ncbi:holo-[acyl-carrier-protein] synthase [Aneurinibacillus soli]|uniref:Holo-[acyl-carrier-protein] synthase n=1 Tax=Aneurinibacillus soli TaxID=1500254 RepID=A0A0U5B1M6_9BACL|nr:holo-ACP synthase [Aneurinibacillus soli]PYE58027.1 holo-[acyl-carrier-protein] synthase [Aneurinibacillus soli]BAU29905.1 Holo-[acyl-carrier-protein] synthase [Aneurinibacillus soli]
MIIGTGIDIVELPRIQKIIERQEHAFVQRVLTAREQKAMPEAPGRRIEYIAGRFAAKEAISKALGTGIGGVVSFYDMEIIPDANGRPIVHIAERVLREIAGTVECRCHISITHSREYAAAQAILEM